MSEENKPQEEKGFRIVDRRRDGRDDEASDQAKTEAKENIRPNDQVTEPPKVENTSKAEAIDSMEEMEKEETGPNYADFSGEEAFAQFIMSLATSAYLHLGLIPGQDGKPEEKNLLLAKQTIDILGMLETKTKGNRTAQEDSLIEQILSELRMRFVEEKKKS